MERADIPTKFQIPFADAAGTGFIRPVPTASQIGIEAGAASLTDGFPPVTFQPVSSGGTPPFGQDFNGILNQITLWNQWHAAGGPVAWDSVFSTAIGGYPQGAVVLSATTAGAYWRSTTDNNTTNPDTGGAGWVDFFPGVANNSVTNAKLAQMAAATVKANLTGSTANASDVSLGALADAMGRALAGNSANFSLTFPGGYIVKGMNTTAISQNAGPQLFNWTNPFPSVCFPPVSVLVNPSAGTGQNFDQTSHMVSWSTAGVTVLTQAIDAASTGQAFEHNIIAVGY